MASGLAYRVKPSGASNKSTGCDSKWIFEKVKMKGVAPLVALIRMGKRFSSVARHTCKLALEPSLMSTVACSAWQG